MNESSIWNKIVEDHYSAHRSVLVKRLHYLGSDAEDVVQEAYERSLKYASSFNGEDFNKWFSIILRNVVRDYKRKQVSKAEEEEIDEFQHIGSYCPGFNYRMWDEVISMINKKPDKHREVLNLYYNLGYTYKDIAAVTNNTYFNAYRIVARFKEELQERFKG